MKKRCFRIHKDRDPWPGFQYWRWECTLCQPPDRGARSHWDRIIGISLPHHFRVRWSHHQWVLRNLGPTYE